MNKTLRLAGAFALTACLSGFAAYGDTWFKGGIDNNPSWPSNPPEATLIEGGEWQNEDAVKTAEGSPYFLTLTNSAKSLVFEADDKKNLSGGTSTIKTEVKFTAYDAGEEPVIPGGTKAGIIVVEDANNALKYYVAAKGENTNVWVEATGPEPSTSNNVTVTMSVKDHNGFLYAQYKIGETILGGGTGTGKVTGWFEVYRESGDTTVGVASYQGLGEIHSLNGEYAENPDYITIGAGSKHYTTLSEVATAVNEGEDGFTATINGNVIVEENVTFTKSGTITIAEGATLAINDGASIIVDGASKVLTFSGVTFADQSGKTTFTLQAQNGAQIVVDGGNSGSTMQINTVDASSTAQISGVTFETAKENNNDFSLKLTGLGKITVDQNYFHIANSAKGAIWANQAKDIRLDVNEFYGWSCEENRGYIQICNGDTTHTLKTRAIITRGQIGEYGGSYAEAEAVVKTNGQSFIVFYKNLTTNDTIVLDGIDCTGLAIASACAYGSDKGEPATFASPNVFYVNLSDKFNAETSTTNGQFQAEGEHPYADVTVDNIDKNVDVAEWDDATPIYWTATEAYSANFTDHEAGEQFYLKPGCEMPTEGLGTLITKKVDSGYDNQYEVAEDSTITVTFVTTGKNLDWSATVIKQGDTVVKDEGDDSTSVTVEKDTDLTFTKLIAAEGYFWADGTTNKTDFVIAAEDITATYSDLPVPNAAEAKIVDESSGEVSKWYPTLKEALASEDGDITLNANVTLTENLTITTDQTVLTDGKVLTINAGVTNTLVGTIKYPTAIVGSLVNNGACVIDGGQVWVGDNPVIATGSGDFINCADEAVLTFVGGNCTVTGTIQAYGTGSHEHMFYLGNATATIVAEQSDVPAAKVGLVDSLKADYEVGYEDGTYYAKAKETTYTIAYYGTDGAEFTSWQVGYEPVTSYTENTETFALPVAENVVLELAGVGFDGWTNATGTVCTEVTKGTTGNLAFYMKVKATLSPTEEVKGEIADAKSGGTIEIPSGTEATLSADGKTLTVGGEAVTKTHYVFVDNGDDTYTVQIDPAEAEIKADEEGEYPAFTPTADASNVGLCAPKTVVGFYYSVEYAAAPNFSSKSETTPVAGTGEAIQLTAPKSGSIQFYRTKVTDVAPEK